MGKQAEIRVPQGFMCACIKSAVNSNAYYVNNR